MHGENMKLMLNKFVQVRNVDRKRQEEEEEKVVIQMAAFLAYLNWCKIGTTE
jgi:hypothetical protein